MKNKRKIKIIKFIVFNSDNSLLTESPTVTEKTIPIVQYHQVNYYIYRSYTK